MVLITLQGEYWFRPFSTTTATPGGYGNHAIHDEPEVR